MRKSLFLLLLVLTILSVACGADKPKSYPEGTMAAVLAADGRFATFLEITDSIPGPHGTDPLLTRTSEQNRTVWAPTDDAFAALPADLLDKLRNDETTAGELLFHHLFDRELYSADFDLLPTWPTYLSAVKVGIQVDGDAITYDGANVIETDIEAGNGVIHVLDAVTGIEFLTD